MIITVLEEFGKALVPEKIFNIDVRSNLRNYLSKAGIRKVPYKFFGILFWVTAILTYITFLSLAYPYFIKGSGMILSFILSFLAWTLIQGLIVTLTMIAIYFNFNVKIFKRTQQIELALPDFLVLVSTNMKGGLSLEQSLWSSIRPEFGLLAEEMTLVSKRVMTGNDLSEALNEFADKYQSPLLQRNLQLIIGEITSGGKIVVVIDKVIDSLKKTRALKEEMAAATIAYIIFIGAIVIVISPALFALAYQLLQIILGFTSSLGGAISSTSAGSSLNFSNDLDISNFKNFSIFALAIIATGSSMIISIIEKGDIRNGLKYIPLFVFGSLIFYLIFMVILASLFGGLV